MRKCVGPTRPGMVCALRFLVSYYADQFDFSVLRWSYGLPLCGVFYRVSRFCTGVS